MQAMRTGQRGGHGRQWVTRGRAGAGTANPVGLWLGRVGEGVGGKGGSRGAAGQRGSALPTLSIEWKTSELRHATMAKASGPEQSESSA